MFLLKIIFKRNMPKRCGYLCLSSISLDSYEVTKLDHKRAGSLIIPGSQHWSWKTSCPTYIRVFRSLTHDSVDQLN